MKKLVIWLLVIVMVLGILSGCGNSSDTSESGTGDEQNSTQTETQTQETGEGLPQYEGIAPSVIFGLEGETKDRLDAQIVTDKALRRMEVTDVPCVLFEHWRSADTNQLRLSLDDSLVSSFEGRIVRISFNAYVSSAAEVSVKYFDEDGTEHEAKASSFATNMWSEFFIQLDKPAFSGKYNGFDFYITFTGPELIRINKITMRTDRTMFSNTPTLIDSSYLSDEYVVADTNVLFYGAAGDGVTDDTNSLKAAIADVQKRGGGTVFLPEGKYLLTSTVNIPNGVSLVGELKSGTTQGTTLFIKHGAGETDKDKSALLLGTQSAIKNMCFYYPDQTLEGGKVTPYPPTILQKAVESITLCNLYFVNAYLAIDAATDHENQSLQHIYNIYGCTLNKFYWNDTSYDIGRIEDIHLGADYWLNSGFGAPDRAVLEQYLLDHAIGLHLQRIDWTYISDIQITGYHSGILADRSSTGASNGHLYNLDFKNVYYGLEGQDFWWFLMTNCKIEVCDRDGATPVYIGAKNSGNMAFNSCTFTGSKNAVLNKGTGRLSFGNCVMSGTDRILVTNASYTMVDCELSGNESDYDNEYSGVEVPDFSAISYAPKYETKPKSTAFIDLSKELAGFAPTRDISAVLQVALDSLKETGGTVYLPAGTYQLDAPIDVWSGIELRGASEAATSAVSPTKINTDYGRDEPEADALITLHAGSGLRGLRISYPQVIADIGAAKPVYTPYAFTVRGDGADIYIINVNMHSSFNGVDFMTNRCDRHYIQYVWGCPINIGIQVGGGSVDGIVRDVHYTPNCFGGGGDIWQNVFSYIMSHSRCFLVTDSENEVLYHNFTYAGWRGMEIGDGAKNCVSICHGTDCGNYASYIGGDCSAVLIDSQLVNLPGGSPDFRAYVYTDPTFEGHVEMYNTGMWGATVNTVYLEGDGDIIFYQGVISNTGKTTFNVRAGTCGIYGIISPEVVTKDVDVASKAEKCEVVGNLFGSGGKYAGEVDQAGNKKA